MSSRCTEVVRAQNLGVGTRGSGTFHSEEVAEVYSSQQKHT